MATQAAAPKQQRPRRMTLESVSSGRKQAPPRILVHGVDGVGKSTLAANAPAPIFIGPEDGSGHLDVARFPAVETWQDVLDGVSELTTREHQFSTLGIDSVDWAEPLVWRHVCESAGVQAIEDVGGGFGKGYLAALDQWRIFLAALEQLQTKRGMGVILIGHSLIKKFQNPEGLDFDRYVLKLNDKAAALLREWCHGVYFAQFEQFAVEERKRVRGVSTGARVLYTQRTAAFDAKDRYGLPEKLPLDWAEFERCRAAGSASTPEALREAITTKVVGLPEALRTQATAALGRAGNDAQKLAQLNSWVNAKVSEQSAA